MAKDDMHIIVFKLLAYLYDCMKKGKEPDRNMFERDSVIFCGVPDRYRCSIVQQVVKRGYVTGLKVYDSDDMHEVVPIDPAITLDGYEYMQENKLMNRALNELKSIKAALPFV